MTENQPRNRTSKFNQKRQMVQQQTNIGGDQQTNLTIEQLHIGAVTVPTYWGRLATGLPPALWRDLAVAFCLGTVVSTALYTMNRDATWWFYLIVFVFFTSLAVAFYNQRQIDQEQKKRWDQWYDKCKNSGPVELDSELRKYRTLLRTLYDAGDQGTTLTATQRRQWTAYQQSIVVLKECLRARGVTVGDDLFDARELPPLPGWIVQWKRVYAYASIVMSLSLILAAAVAGSMAPQVAVQTVERIIRLLPEPMPSPTATVAPTRQPTATILLTSQPTATAVLVLRPTATITPTLEPTATAVLILQPTATVEPTPTATPQPTPQPTPTVAPPATPTSIPAAVEQAVTGIIRATTVSGSLPGQNDQHFLGLEPDSPDAQIRLRLTIEPQDNNELVNSLNFWVLDTNGFAQYLAGIAPSDVAIAAGNSVVRGLANERVADFRAVGNATYTVIVYNNATVPGTYELTVGGGLLVDESGQTNEAQGVFTAQ